MAPAHTGASNAKHILEQMGPHPEQCHKRRPHPERQAEEEYWSKGDRRLNRGKEVAVRWTRIQVSGPALVQSDVSSDATGADEERRPQLVEMRTEGPK